MLSCSGKLTEGFIELHIRKVKSYSFGFEKLVLYYMILTLILFQGTGSLFLGTVATGHHSGMHLSPITEFNSVLGYAMERELVNSTVFSCKPIELHYVTLCYSHQKMN